MYQYRITKYDPALRSSTGRYLKDEWTVFSDIGRSFGGTVFGEEEYLRVEAAYVETAADFLAEDHAPSLRVVELEVRRAMPGAPSEGALVPRSELIPLCRSILRDQFWCKLEADGRFVHFGWDYYMYLGVLSPCTRAILKAQALGLFVENFDSPYGRLG